MPEILSLDVSTAGANALADRLAGRLAASRLATAFTSEGPSIVKDLVPRATGLPRPEVSRHPNTVAGAVRVRGQARRVDAQRARAAAWMMKAARAAADEESARIGREARR